MTAQLYIRGRAMADRMLAKYGKSAALQRYSVTGPSYAPVRTPDAPVACTVLQTDHRVFGREQINVEVNDVFGLIRAVPGFSVDDTDELVMNGHTFRFIILRPLEPGDLLLLYKFQARV